MKFTKMQGCGNDYVYVNGFVEKIEESKKSEIIRFLSDRHFGIGGDGVIFINPGKIADFEMEMWNADGTRAQMCGNGVRCVAKYVYDHKMVNKPQFTVESMGKIKYMDCTVENDKVVSVRVNMGEPILEAKLVPAISENEKIIDEDFEVNGKNYKVTCVSMGNPHAIVFVDDVKSLDLEKIGPFFENHKRFPERINTEFVKVIDKDHVEMRVWERGTGETLACGTGCCALTVACIENGLTNRKVNIKVLGGEINCEWDEKENVVYMTGPATTVFDGEINI